MGVAVQTLGPGPARFALGRDDNERVQIHQLSSRNFAMRISGTQSGSFA